MLPSKGSRGVRRQLLALMGFLGAVVVVVARGENVPPQSPWSPEAAPLVYTSKASGNSDIWLRSDPGGPPVRLTHDEAQDHWASFFPSGTRIAYQSLRGGQREIWVVGLDGGGLVNLSAHPAQDLLPEVSPDGRWLLFTGAPLGERQFDLLAVPVDGGEVETIVATELDERSGSWLPRR